MLLSFKLLHWFQLLNVCVCCCVRFHLHFPGNAVVLCSGWRWRVKFNKSQKYAQWLLSLSPFNLETAKSSGMFQTSHFIEITYAIICNLYFNKASVEMQRMPSQSFSSFSYLPLVLHPHALTGASILSFYKHSWLMR